MMDENQPLVSIVIPAYNVSDYLDECLESVVSQTYANLEIVLVDDGSTDDTGVKCDAWAKKDIRIRVLHQKNGGLSAARNAGILHCNGEYLLALDSDDRIKQDLVRKCVSSLEDSSADLVHFGYSSITESGAHVNNHPDPEAEGDELLLLILSSKLPSHSWQLLCKRGLYDGILFPEGRKAEDVATTYKLISRADNSVTIPDCLYEYRTRKGSILSNPEKAVQYYVDELLAFREMIQWAKATGLAEYVRAVQNSMVHHLFFHYKTELAAHSEEGIEWVSNQLSKELRNIDSNSLEGAEKKKAAMFRNGSLAFCYRFGNALRKTAKQLLRRIRRVSK
ncbi:glycosyltransferase family 2 protein [Bifidobacterium longum]|jgi:glycosyltransferase involved in cell wall biosynthesis|uniref:glycosyltransferase family 2 protein n=1 Tax=Bifidobacterium longum TaxID=216816 RepID=UPI001FB5E7D3|nr:glycosyltransferase family 2 protein [Bifidobacterium longum]UOG10441.1 glycosyltransferase [Bifidobacterium longum subsp. infantis]